MSRNSGAEVVAGVGLAVIGLSVIWLYLRVKEFSAWAHLAIASAAWLLAGLLAVGASVFMTQRMNISFSKVVPWLPLVLFGFSLPALNYWSLAHEADYVFDYSPAWYGVWWGQWASCGALLGFGYLFHKLLNDN